MLDIWLLSKVDRPIETTHNFAMNQKFPYNYFLKRVEDQMDLDVTVDSIGLIILKLVMPAASPMWNKNRR